MYRLLPTTYCLMPIAYIARFSWPSALPYRRHLGSSLRYLRVCVYSIYTHISYVHIYIYTYRIYKLCNQSECVSSGNQYNCIP